MGSRDGIRSRKRCSATWKPGPTWPAADRYPRDEALACLLAELRAGSDEFTRIWRTNPVRVPGHRTKTMTHPEAGRLHLNCDVLTVPDDDQQVVFMTADPGSASASALRWLAATAAA